MKQEAEKRIIEAARELFYEKGFTGVTVREIASKAGVNLALLHYYFRTKEKIFESVFDEAFSLLFMRLGKALSSDVNLFEKINRIVSSYIATAMKYPQLASFIMHELSINGDFVWKRIDSNKENASVNISFMKFVQEITEATENGTIKKIDPKILFIDMISLSLFPFVGSAFFTRFLYDNERAQFDVVLKSRTAHVCELIIKSLHP